MRIKKMLFLLALVGASLSFGGSGYDDGNTIKCGDGRSAIVDSEQNLRNLTRKLNAAIPDSVDFSFSYDDMAFYAYVCRKNQKNEATELLTWEIDKLFQLASEGGIVYESECSDCFGVCKIDMSDLMRYLIKYGLDDLIRSSGQPVNNETRAFFLNVYSNGEMFQQFVNQGDNLYRSELKKYYNVRDFKLRALPADEEICEKLGGTYVEFFQGRCVSYE